jgi:hypothetical protein
MPFLDDDFLLASEPARDLYHRVAADQLFVDDRCHRSPRDIAEDRRFADLHEACAKKGPQLFLVPPSEAPTGIACLDNVGQGRYDRVRGPVLEDLRCPRLSRVPKSST